MTHHEALVAMRRKLEAELDALQARRREIEHAIGSIDAMAERISIGAMEAADGLRAAGRPLPPDAPPPYRTVRPPG